ncbi:MAG: ATP-binding protein [Gemmatimonadota bacterium]|jgi:two-component system NtrC family sensor kinase
MSAHHLQRREPSVTAPGVGSADGAQGAQQALMQRPVLSIRTRVTVVFVVLFVLLSSVTAAAVVFLSAFEDKIVFLESASSYSTEIEEARRNEKNFFLYGTGLPEALASASVAHSHLRRSADQMRSVVGREKYAEMEASLGRYEALLEQVGQTGVGAGAERQAIEVRLRTEGAQLLSDAQEMIDRERLAVSSMLHTSRIAAFGFLGLMLLVMVLFGGFVVRAVIGPLNRFMQYVARIGAGNYEPIRPARRYRDEFSTLALAFNQMLGEIVSRQDQLVQSGKMAAVGTLTSGIAHELNNPLNNIGLTVEAMIDDFDAYSDDQKRRMLEQAYTQVERASTTVRNLLDFTRKGRSAFTTFNVSEAVESALRLVANEAMLGGVECHTSLDADLPPIEGNPHDLQQVFLNLFLNAIQAMPEGGAMRVSASHEGDTVRIDVSDEGVGIPGEHLESIFDPFFTTKAVGEGTGLGLSVSHSIVEKHGGRIEVASEPGKGTTFSVHLPVADARIHEPV